MFISSSSFAVFVLYKWSEHRVRCPCRAGVSGFLPINFYEVGFRKVSFLSHPNPTENKTVFISRQHLLLVAEGWIYFTLALLELLSVVPSLSIDNVNRFRLFDIGIGTSPASFI
jgi:hypothetical protein